MSSTPGKGSVFSFRAPVAWADDSSDRGIQPVALGGKKAVVLGQASGVGEMISKWLSKAGMVVRTVDFDPAVDLEPLDAHCLNGDGRLHGDGLDVAVVDLDRWPGLDGNSDGGRAWELSALFGKGDVKTIACAPPVSG